MTDTSDMNLTVEIPADKWANTQRRITFLEAVLLQVLREECRIREWFTAREISAMNLPGLTYSPAGITRKSVHQKWAYKTVKQDGRAVLAYHYSSLPARAFEAFVKRIADLPEDQDIAPDLPAPEAVNTTLAPQWMLPLMRIIRNDEVETWQDAYDLLLTRLPHDVAMPDHTAIHAAFMRQNE